MSATKAKSATYKKTSNVRTINTRFHEDRLCRYLISGNRRCQRTSAQSGSGLCILHDRQLTQLRDAESRSLGHAALGKVTDFNSAVSIHGVLSRVVILGLQRRYSTREVAVFTSALKALRQTLDEAAFDIRRFHGAESRDLYISRALDAEPSLRRPRTKSANATAPAGNAPTAATLADLLQSGRINREFLQALQTMRNKSESEKSNEAENKMNAAPAPKFAGRASSNGRPVVWKTVEEPIEPPVEVEDTPAPQSPAANENQNNPSKESQTPPPPREVDPNDGSIPYTHMQSYGGIKVPLYTRLRTDK